MKKLLFLIVVLTALTQAQPLAGKKICLDPGHGMPRGATCDAVTKLFEAYINHIVVPYVKRYLQGAGATVITTRADFDSLGACLSLTERKAIANNANATLFHSVHHNAYTGTSNYTLGLFKQISTANCPTGNPQWPGQSDALAQIMATRLFNSLYTTSGRLAGDSCFLGFNLGVLSTLNMPGTLSEASFFDFPEEKLRLANLAYLETEAEALYYSFLQHYNAPFPATGSITGVITNSMTGTPAKLVSVAIDSIGKNFLVDNLGNGYYRFDSLPAGNYRVTVRSQHDTVSAYVTVQAGVIKKQNLGIRILDTVGDVKLRTVISNNSILSVTWDKPEGSVESYRVFLSEDGVTWDTVPRATAGGSAFSAAVSGLSAGKPYYVRVKAKNAISESRNFSKVFGAFTSTSSDKALVVDGFNRTNGGYTQQGHPFVVAYGNALTANGVKFETVAGRAVTSGTQLLAYKYVFWMLGDESVADTALTGTEIAAISDYLKQGGNLYISGSELGYDLSANGTAAERAFYEQILKAKYISDAPAAPATMSYPLPGTLFDSLTSAAIGTRYPVQYPDVIDTLAGSTRLHYYTPTEYSGILYTGMYPGGVIPGKHIYFAIPFETLGSEADRTYLARRALAFFRNTTSTAETPFEQPKTVEVTVFPNPFNPVLQVTVTVPTRAEYRIRVCSAAGEAVAELYAGELSGGTHRFSSSMSRYPSGVYFIRLAGGGISASTKAILIK